MMFDPRDLGNLAVWLDAMDRSTIDADGSNIVTTWRNKGAASVGNAAQSTTTKKPLLTASAINSRPALRGRHDGSNASNMEIADHAGLNYSTCSIFAVISRVTDLAGNEFVAAKGDVSGNTREFRFGLNVSDQAQLAVSSNGSSIASTTTTATTVATATPKILFGGYDGANSFVGVGGGTRVDTAGSAWNNGTGTFQIFSRDTNTEPYAGYIGELLFFNAVLSANNALKIMRYLSAKWAIALG
jgi:hypothetical protein